MKPTSVIATSVLLLAASCAGHSNPESRQQTLMEASRQELASAVGERDELLALLRDITIEMNHIREMEGIISISPQRPQENMQRRSQALADIKDMRRVMARRRRQLDSLETKLRKSSLYNDGLQASIDAVRSLLDSHNSEIESLHAQLVDANRHIGTLNNTVGTLNNTVGCLNSQVNALNHTVADVEKERDSVRLSSLRLEKELNACYYVVAPKSRLAASHIIEPSFLRKTKLMKDDFDRHVFTLSDKRTLRSIPIEAKKIRILTNHPASSFEITGTGNTRTLLINNSEKFWSLSSYLVIQTD